jgi:aldose 1-epimerase
VPSTDPLQVAPYGSVDGREVELYTLASERLRVELLTYGGIIRAFHAPDRDGALANVALGFATLEDYVERSPHFGCITGRYANRIRAGRFTLDGVEHQLAVNNPPNALHGGTQGFDKRVWDATPLDGARISLRYVSKDGEEGYPGRLAVSVDYRLDGDELRIDYHARNESSDRSTVVNVTNHAYWNLRGEGSGNVLDHVVELPAEAYTPIDETLIPTGEIAAVAGTPLDFRTPTRLGERIDAPHEQIRYAGGYDHNYVLDGAAGDLRLAARVHEPASGRTLEVLTTEPGLQLYSGNFLDGTLTGSSGRRYGRRDGLALETQHFPDSPNQPGFPSTVLGPGAELRSTTIFRLTALQ